MAVCAPTTTSASRLNPNAPFFVPAAFCAVEDFSPDWWHFIQSSPAFREYWLTERFDPEPTSDLDLIDLLEFESEELVEEEDGNDRQDDVPDSSMDLKDFARLAGLEPEYTHSKLSRRPFSPLPYQDKPLKVTRPQKPGMRKIQQPR